MLRWVLMNLLLLSLAACSGGQAVGVSTSGFATREGEPAPASTPVSREPDPTVSAADAPAGRPSPTSSPPVVPSSTPTATRVPTSSPSPAPTPTSTYTATPTPTPTRTLTASPTPTPLHPLSIEYMRQQTYPGSAISIEETLAPGANYDRYIASYLSEGNRIYALLTVPRGARPQSGWPVILFNHGYIPPQQYSTTERYVAYVDVDCAQRLHRLSLGLSGAWQFRGRGLQTVMRPRTIRSTC